MSDIFAGIPKKHFGAILADPPWQFEAWSGLGTDRAAENHYRTLSIKQITELPIAELAAEDCVLFMWVVWPTLPDALEVIKAWGFQYKTCAFSWMKADPYKLWALEEDVYLGLGYWTRANSEVCLLATRGKPRRLDAGVRQGIIAPKREHSRKPEGVHDRIERLVAGPYLELFARQQRLGWVTWGNEVDKFTGATP